MSGKERLSLPRLSVFSSPAKRGRSVVYDSPNSFVTPPPPRRASMMPSSSQRVSHSTLVVPSFTKTHWNTSGRFLANWPATRTFQEHQGKHQRLHELRRDSAQSSSLPARASARPRPSSTTLSRRISTHAKPTFLTNLEELLSRKLRRASTISEDSNLFRARYRAHRDVFRSFAGHFAAYRPLMLGFLKSFDDYVDRLETEVSSGRHMHERTRDVENDCDIRLHRLQTDHAQEIASLRKLLAEHEKARESAVASEKASTEEASRVQRELRHLTSELQEMRLNAETLTTGLRQSTEEVMRMKVQLREADAKVRTHRRIQNLYRDALKRMRSAEQMVKKEDFDQAVEECRQYKSLSERLNAQLRAMRSANEKLTHDVIRLKLDLRGSESAAYGQQGGRMTSGNADGVSHSRAPIRRTHTPRPNWASVKRILPSFDPDRSSSAGIARQLESYIVELQQTVEAQQGRLGKQEKILGFLNDRNLFAKKESMSVNVAFFIGKGTHSRIPPYLRYNGKVRNRSMTKGEVEDLLIDIWKVRKAKLARQREGTPQPFDEYFDAYLEAKFGTAAGEKAEWCYSLLHGCQKYRFDPDCDIFLKILRREISEDCFDEQFRLVEQLRGEFEKLDVQMNGEIAGLVRKSDVFAMLDAFFHAKSASDLHDIKVVLGPLEEVFEYVPLFEEDSNHTQSEFVEMIRSQYVIEVEEYTVDVEQELWSLENVNGRVSLKQIRHAFHLIDPKKSVQQVDALINHGLGRPPDTKMRNLKTLVHLDSFINNLKKRVLRRSTPKELVYQVLEQMSKRRVREFGYSAAVVEATKRAMEGE